MWAPQIIPVLDDNRIVAAHAEIHYILSALNRKTGPWWLHPETQRFWNQEPVLYALHDMVVSEMKERAFNHKTPIEDSFLRATNMLIDLEWVYQDAADLYRKWAKENRWSEEGFFFAGMMTKNGFKDARKPDAAPPLREELEKIAERWPQRVWTKADRERLREEVRNRESK